MVQPDLIYIDERRQALLSDRALAGARPLRSSVIPVPSQVDRHTKMALYAAQDVTWYWIVDPDARTIEAYRLEGGAYRFDATLEGVAPRTLPPFLGLPLDPAAVWP